MSEPKRPLKVFLCHASADKPKVRELYRYLKRRGIQPWFDEEHLVGGQDWQVEIPKALATSDAIIICLTKNSVDKEGYIQKEIKFALDKALEMPEGRIFLIPVKFEECDVPFSLSRYQWVDLTIESGYAKMMKALKFRASQLERSTVELSKKAVEEENPALEKAAREKEEREAAEKVASEKAEKDAVEKARLEAEEQTRQKAEREKTEREALERAEQERREKEFHENQARVGREKAKRVTEKKEEKSVTIKPKAGGQIAYWFGGFIVLILGTVFLSSLNSPSSTLQPTPENTQTQVVAILVQDTVEPSTTLTPKSTSTPTDALTSTTLPVEITDIKGVKMNLVANEFYMDKYEVTNALYKACVESGTCLLPTNANRYVLNDYSNHPVVYVDLSMAETYCQWREARLPTGDEWDVAARGDISTKFPWGNDNNCEYANIAYGISNGQYCVGTTTPVGSYELGKSAYNIYDLIGNVWEWTTIGFRLHGGGWSTYQFLYEDPLSVEWTSNTIGFRCVKGATP